MLKSNDTHGYTTSYPLEGGTLDITRLPDGTLFGAISFKVGRNKWSAIELTKDQMEALTRRKIINVNSNHHTRIPHKEEI